MFRTALKLYGGLKPEHAYEKDALDRMSTSAQAAVASEYAPAHVTSVPRVDAMLARARIASIDVMRGLVMVIMLMDHVREAIYRHLQVGDPMNVATTAPDLFFTRLSAHLCAPTFVKNRSGAVEIGRAHV